MLLAHLQIPKRKLYPMTITPKMNPGDDLVDRRPCTTPEKEHFMKKLGECLEALGKACGDVPLRMGKLGWTQFRFHKFTIVVEVPSRDSFLRVYTLLHRTHPSDSPELRMNLLKTALEVNYLQLKTFGACLSLDPCPSIENELELNLSFTYNMIGLAPKEFVLVMVHYMQTIRDVYTEIMTRCNLRVDMDGRKAKKSPPPKAEKRKAWISFPADHPRDLKVLDEKDLASNVEEQTQNDTDEEKDAIEPEAATLPTMDKHKPDKEESSFYKLLENLDKQEHASKFDASHGEDFREGICLLDPYDEELYSFKGEVSPAQVEIQEELEISPPQGEIRDWIQDADDASVENVTQQKDEEVSTANTEAPQALLVVKPKTKLLTQYPQSCLPPQAPPRTPSPREVNLGGRLYNERTNVLEDQEEKFKIDIVQIVEESTPVVKKAKNLLPPATKLERPTGIPMPQVRRPVQKHTVKHETRKIVAPKGYGK